MKIVNIYSQQGEHCEAKIVGNNEGLRELIKAIMVAIESGYGETSKKEGIIASDGEGYIVKVARMPDDWIDPKWEDYIPNYQDKIGEDCES